MTANILDALDRPRSAASLEEAAEWPQRAEGRLGFTPIPGQLWERTAELAESARFYWLPTPSNVVDVAVDIRVRNQRMRDRGYQLPLAVDHDHSRSGIYKEGRRIQ